MLVETGNSHFQDQSFLEAQVETRQEKAHLFGSKYKKGSDQWLGKMRMWHREDAYISYNGIS